MDPHQIFTDWSRRQGVEINGIESTQLPGRGRGLTATRHIKASECVLLVPKRAILKPDERFSERERLKRPSPQAMLVAKLLMESRDKDSFYAPWIATWPSVQEIETSMPDCWPQELNALIPPAAKKVMVRQAGDCVVKDWEATHKLFERVGSSFKQFQYLWLIVNSRSFCRKYNGVLPTTVMCPFIDYANHGPSGSGCHVKQSDKGFEVIAQRDYAVGEELLVNYGAHSNDKLFVHYGFICPTPPSGFNADDDIGIDHVILVKLDEATKEQLRTLGYLGGYTLLPATNEICHKTEVAVRALLLPYQEWKDFVETGEDAVPGRQHEVLVFVQGLFQQFRRQCLFRIGQVTKLEDGVTGRLPHDMLLMRWRQMLDAIEMFLKRV